MVEDMALEQELREKVGSVVRLDFTDGEIADVRLCAVDTDEHHDIVYEVVRVHRAAARPASNKQAFVRARIDEVSKISDPG